MHLLRKVRRRSARARLPELPRTLVAETTENGKASLVEEQDVGRVGALDRREALAFVKACRICVFSAQTHTTEVSPGLFHQGGHQCPADPPVSPGRPDVNATETAYIRPAGKRVKVKATDCEQQTFLQVAAQGLPRSIEAILGACPLLDQGFNEVVPFLTRVRQQTLYAGNRQLNFLDRDHRFLTYECQ